MKEKTLARWTTIFAVAGALTAAGVVALPSAPQEDADGPWQLRRGGRGARHGRFMRGGMLRQLNLTDEQLNQLREARQAQLEATETEREALIEARRVFREAVREGEESGIYAAAQTLAEAEAALAIARSGSREILSEILTPEQKKEWEELLAKREELREERLQIRKERRQNWRDERPERLR